MTDKRQKATENKSKRDESTVVFEMYIKTSLGKGFEFCLTIIDQEKHLHFNPHDYQINYVNIDFVCHQCGFCVMKVQMSLVSSGKEGGDQRWLAFIITKIYFFLF